MIENTCLNASLLNYNPRTQNSTTEVTLVKARMSWYFKSKTKQRTCKLGALLNVSGFSHSFYVNTTQSETECVKHYFRMHCTTGWKIF